MLRMPRNTFSKGLLLCGVSAGAIYASTGVAAQDADAADDAGLEEITVTATRRAASVQDVPLNIAAVGGSQIQEQGFSELSDLLTYVPGINVVDGGGRQGNPIIVRGLNAESLGSNDGNNSGGGTVATYVGEIPLYVDLRLNDLERVEVLLGPQGTLYGSGTLGGAIRYIPAKPKFEETTFSVRGSIYNQDHASSLSYETGFTANVPITENFAIRASLDYTDDSGFIDYVNVVQTPGVSDPDPFDAGEDPSANIRTVEDADGEEILSGRIAARFTPTDAIDATLTYYYQKSDIEGRRTSHLRDNVPGVGRYDSAFRVLEPNSIENDLLALEVTADLGFAELTSASGYSTFSDDGQRDQTSLLITLEYSYELFPSFTSFTREEGREERINQELRLVSTTDGPLNWIVGGFYNELKVWGSSSEFTPNYDTYAIDTLGFDFLVDRPDDLEYFSTSNSKLVETALFGEVGYEIIDGLTITVGGRYYDYELESASSVDFPLFDLGFVASSLDEIKQTAFDPELGQSDDGFLYKVNVSYQATDDVLAYFTISEGYRIGGSNGVGQCEEFDPNAPATQGACALAPDQVFFPGGPNDVSTRDERQFFPDTTTNYELGLKTTLLDGALRFNTALYYIKWSDPQLGSATVNANIPITVNADGASSQGFETNFDWQATEQLRLRGNFSYTDSKLTAVAPALIRTITPPGFSSAFIDGQDGDRLPGSPKTKFSIFASYEQPLAGDRLLTYNAGLSHQGSVLTRAGGRGNSLTLGAITTVDASVSYRTDNWGVTLFAENLFDEYGETGAVGTELRSQVVSDFDGGNVYPRAFRTIVLPPRSIGLRFNYDF